MLDAQVDLSERKPEGHRLVYVAAMAMVIAMGFYFQHLNEMLYQRQAPFYDSMSYYDRLHEVVSLRQQQGLGIAINAACFKESTTCFPYLLGVGMSYVSPPTRAMAVWIEIFYFSIFLVFLIYYLTQIRKMTPMAVMIAIVPFFLISGLYRVNSGMADFRIDLPMAFLYGAISCQYLIACHRTRWADFMVLGLLVAIACLTRAIAPVYLMVGFVPLIIIHAFRTPQRGRFLAQCAAGLGITAIGAGWFYYAQIEFLNYYYFRWNTDANANIPIWETYKHALTAAKSIGPFVAVFFLSLFTISQSLPKRKGHQNTESTPSAPGRPHDFYWLMWLGAAPIVLLIAKRADANPFVTLPAATGLMLFWIIAQQERLERLVSLRLQRTAYVCGVCLMMALVLGFIKHRFPDTEAQEAHHQILAQIIRDAEKRDQSHVRVDVNVMTFVTTDSLKSTLQYDKGFRFVDGRTLEKNGLRIQSSRVFFLPSQTDWQRIEGATIDEKITSLYRQAQTDCDYIVSATMESVPAIQARIGATLTTRYSADLISPIQSSPNWEPVGKPIATPHDINVQIYRNTSPSQLTHKGKLADRNLK